MENKRHKNCRHLLDSLSDFVDGSLADEVCAEIERHLAECEDCHIVVDTLRKTVYLYHSTSEQPVIPSEVRDRLYKRLNLEDLLETDA